MPAQNLDTVMTAVDQLLTGAMDEAQMPAAAEALRRLFNGSKACFAGFGPHPDDWVSYATHVDETLQARCFGDLARDFIEMGFALRNIPLGQVYQDHEVHGRERLQHSRVWQEWMQPQDMYGGMACRLSENGEAFWFFDVQRGRQQETFDRDDIALLAKLYPVLRRIVEVRRHLGRIAIQRDEARNALDALAMGIVIVDQDLRIVYANEEADEILADPDGALSLRQGRVFARQPTEQRLFRQLVEAAAHGGGDPLAHQRSSMILSSGCAHSLSACVMPAASPVPAGSHRKIMIALRRLDAATDMVTCARQLFDLTETEAKFASALASGLSLTEAAEAQGVRISTARTHLARIFQKTHTRQQSQLVSLLRSAALPFRGR